MFMDLVTSLFSSVTFRRATIHDEHLNISSSLSVISQCYHSSVSDTRSNFSLMSCKGNQGKSVSSRHGGFTPGVNGTVMVGLVIPI